MQTPRPYGKIMTGMLLFGSIHVALANPWPAQTRPSDSSPHAIGQVSNGCIAGAEPLAIEGTGYRIMNQQRNRYYGHPHLIRVLQEIGVFVHQRGYGRLQIGDMSQAKGGPMPSGHHSHQNGLDADIWFELETPHHQAHKPGREYSHSGAPSMLTSDKDTLDLDVWSDSHREILRKAASIPQVDRIFVNPNIKLDLCRHTQGPRAWLQKIRPWYGHNEHFHLRITCPADNFLCEQQNPLPSGDGCDDPALDWWLQQPLPPTLPQPVPEKNMPVECRSVLYTK
jgi:penicillin-insensitive murein endopeptidase